MRHPRSPAPDANDLRARLADWADAMTDLKRRYAVARKRLLELRRQGNDQAYAFWRLVDEVTSGTPPLYVGGGMRTMRAFVKTELEGETQRSAARSLRVVRAFCEADFKRFDRGLLEELALLEQARGRLPAPPATIDTARLRVSVHDARGNTVRKRIEELTVAEVRRARRALSTGDGSRRNAPAEEKSLRKVLGANPSLSEVGIQLVRGRLSLTGIPLEALDDLAHALLTFTRTLSSPRGRT